jgi:hypothetical protein
VDAASKPWRDRKHWRSVSTSEISAVGVPHTSAACAVSRSNAASGSAFERLQRVQQLEAQRSLSGAGAT